jgi:hypothetical protein
MGVGHPLGSPPVFVLSVTLALAASCPPPADPAPGGTLSADGAVHLLVRDDQAVCWWIVDDVGDMRVGARWDLTRRHAVALAALADGRVVVVLAGEEGWQLGVRVEQGPERRLRVSLPAPPDRLLVHPERPLAALVWARRGGGAGVWLVDVDAGEVVARAELPSGHGARITFDPDAPALVVDRGALTLSPGSPDAPR